MNNQFSNQANQSGIPHQYHQQGGNYGFGGNGANHIQLGLPFHHQQPTQGVLSGYPHHVPGQQLHHIPGQQPQFFVQGMPGFVPPQQFHHPVSMLPFNPRVQSSFVTQNVPRVCSINPHQQNIGGQCGQMVTNQPVQYQEPREIKQSKNILKFTDPESKEEVLLSQNAKTEMPIVVKKSVEQPSQIQTNLKEMISQKLCEEGFQSNKDVDQKKSEVVAEFQREVAKLKEIETSAKIVDESVQKIRQKGGEDALVLAYHKLFLAGFYDVLASSLFCPFCVEGCEDKEQVRLLNSFEMEDIKCRIDIAKASTSTLVGVKSYNRDLLRLLRVAVSKISLETLDSLQPIKSLLGYKPHSGYMPQNYGRLMQPVVAVAFQTNNQRQGYATYQGRSSDKGISGFSSQRKGPITGRASLDRSQMAPPLSEKIRELPVKRSATAWKPKREQKLDPSEAKYLKTKLEIRGLLNKVTPSNYEDMKSEFCNFQVHSDEKMLSEVIDLIFDKAVEEPRFCPMYADLCKDQVISERSLSNEQSDLFRKGILNKCQRNFNPQGSEDELKKLQEKLHSDPIEEAEKELLEGKISLFKSKSKRRAKGIITLIAELYRHAMLHDIIINWCILQLLRLHDSLQEEEYIEFAVHFLETVGPVYDIHRNAYLKKRSEYEKKKRNFDMNSADKGCWRKETEEEAKNREAKEKEEELAMEEPKEQAEVEKIFLHLNNACSQFSQRTAILIMNLMDSRQNKWKQQLEKQGLKTIDEVRQEAEQELQEKSKLRHEFNQKQADQRKYGTYSVSRQQPRSSIPYFGRDSGNSGRSQGQYSRDDSKNMKLSKAAQNSQNAGSEAPLRDISELRKVDSDKKLRSTSTFAQQFPKKSC